ncbi:Na+/H+ antiporter NhaC family protein [Anaerobranca gottschalkii]|uniref:Transporter, NhaC family (TC 2.A.35) n=1 Tax=Anaerobranca gottschalkii DSM 13577 TaxID=1120990 RepID=A0A1I0A3I5_9FIRM|nr:Na+/H+ antiporter NhaC family protein [Anaerobranca gottschalkii]SES88269.1 transporter, NhaC family (TC 2.A.35) [Anaerobranca gottschalkii DSM 13577]
MKRYFSHIILGFILFSIFSAVLLKISLLYPFLVSILFSFLILWKAGFKIGDLFKSSLSGLIECKGLFLLIILIGANISLWMASGIVPGIMYFGFNYLNGLNFILTAFLFTSLMAVFTGTAVGTISTLGIALLGIGRGYGIDDGILLGVLVSGAFIGDKISPLSGLLNLTLKTTETNYRKVIKSMMQTFIPVFITTSLIYLIIGITNSQGVDSKLIEEFQYAINYSFSVSPFILLFPVFIIFLPLLGLKIIPTIGIGLLGGIFLSIFLQGYSLTSVLEYILFGFRGETPSAMLNSILISSGVKGMVEVVFIVAAIIALSSLLEGAGILKNLIDILLINVKGTGELIFRTGILASLLTVVTCDQTAGIVLPGRLFKEKYDKLGVKRENLARTISDTGTVIAPIIPWNINAIIISLITGISPLRYWPYAVLCYLFPLTVIAIYLLERLNNRGHSLKNRVSN